MTRFLRYLLAASAALPCAVPDAFAQYVPVQPAPAQAAPAQAVPVQPPAAQPVPVQQTVPVQAAPAQPQAYAPPQVALQPPPQPRLQVAAFTGWQVNGDIDGVYGKLKVDDAQSFGLSLWTQVRPGTKLELLWIYSKTTAQYDSYGLTYPSTKPFDVDTHYFQLGGVQSVRRGKVEPFFGATLGAVWYAPDNIQSATGLTSYSAGDTWRFAVTLGGGLNVFLSESLAIRGYARMLVPMYFNGGSVYVGTGGSGLAVNAGVPAISGDFGAALVLAR